MILNVNDINVYYGSFHVLWNISLSVNECEIVAVLGPNGAGKTTLLNTIMGLVPNKDGLIKFKDKVINNLKTFERVSLGISLVPEGKRIFPELTVLENLIAGSYINRKERGKMLEIVFTLFPILNERKNQLASTLSGGEQQMLAIGRALMMNPRLLLLDEISAGLAPKICEKVFGTIKKLAEDRSILIVDQNVKNVLEIADRIYVLREGRIVLHNYAESITEEDIIEAFFGVTL
ncbi:MAG: ABC transporter ATP-binding protein [Candidatus Bathyarchaeia archaeon]